MEENKSEDKYKDKVIPLPDGIGWLLIVGGFVYLYYLKVYKSK